MQVFSLWKSLPTHFISCKQLRKILGSFYRLCLLVLTAKLGAVTNAANTNLTLSFTSVESVGVDYGREVGLLLWGTSSCKRFLLTNMFSSANRTRLKSLVRQNFTTHTYTPLPLHEHAWLCQS